MRFNPKVNQIIENIQKEINPEVTREYAFSEAIKLYDLKKYFEAHEVFEFQWKKEVGDIKLLIQALIQLCVAMHKVYIKVNFRGALSQSILSREKLSKLVAQETITQDGRRILIVLIEKLNQLIQLLEGDLFEETQYSPPILSENLYSLFIK